MRKILVRVSFLVVMSLIPSMILAKDLVIGLSPYQESAAAEAQVKSVLQYLIKSLEPGDSAMIFDAYHIRTLGNFIVPNKPAYRHPKAKIQANSKVVKNMLDFAKQARKPKGGDEPSLMGAMRWPQALRFIGENYPAAKGSDLILLGTPIYDDPNEKLFNMSAHLIPGDGHLAHARNVTPYGIKGQESLLSKWRVHLGFANRSWQKDENHGFRVQRFWTLHVEQQGGSLVSFTNDLPTLLQRVQSKVLTPKHSYELQKTAKLEMLQLSKPRVKQDRSIYERPLSKEPPAEELVGRATNVEVGITWDCSWCDLDLYVRPGHSAKTLSFQTMESEAGEYFKDWQRSPRATNGYETVVLNGVVDMTTLFLAVNLYGGRTEDGVQGELRISLDGQTYAAPFHLEARIGNVGAEREQVLRTGQAPNPYWLVINPLDVIGHQKDSSTLARQ